MEVVESQAYYLSVALEKLGVEVHVLTEGKGVRAISVEVERVEVSEESERIL